MEYKYQRSSKMLLPINAIVLPLERSTSTFLQVQNNHDLFISLAEDSATDNMYVVATASSLQQDQDLRNLNILNLISTRETLQTGDVNPSKKAEYARLSILNDH